MAEWNTFLQSWFYSLASPDKLRTIAIRAAKAREELWGFSLAYFLAVARPAVMANPLPTIPHFSFPPFPTTELKQFPRPLAVRYSTLLQDTPPRQNANGKYEQVRLRHTRALSLTAAVRVLLRDCLPACWIAAILSLAINERRAAIFLSGIFL